MGVKKTLRVAVVVSGRGSNLIALHQQASAQDYEIAAVVSNSPRAQAIAYARDAALPVIIVDHRDYSSREDFEIALAEALDRLRPDVVALAGFLRVLGPAFVRRYRGRLINIHPSLLPAFPGLNTHQRALDAGVQEHGATVHFVTDVLDGGPIIAQARLTVVSGESAECLAQRVRALEHVLYPAVLGQWAQGEVHYPPDAPGGLPADAH